MLLDDNNHVLDQLPAYVLDALTDEETLLVAEHLDSCSTCQAELKQLQHVADELPLALIQTTPPARVKEQLMSSIHARKLAPHPAEKLSTWQKLAAGFRVRLPAISLAFILLLAVGNLLLWRQLNRTAMQAQVPMRVIALASTQNSPSAVGTLIMDPGGTYGTLVVDSLAPLDTSRQYQVWLIKGTSRTSGGVFSVNAEGYASIELSAPQPLISYDGIGVTVEPAGGSPGPTGAKVMGGDLPH